MGEVWVKITPIDTLFFRDGRPFTMGVDTWARTIFPPNPSTIYGAIRTWLIYERGGLEKFLNGEFMDELGTKDKKGSLKIKGPFLMSDEHLLFPTPYDLLLDENRVLDKDRNENRNEKRLYKLSFLDFSRNCVFSDYKMEKFLVWNKEKVLGQPEDGYITEIYFNDYMNNKDKLGFIDKDYLLTEELKIGIRRNKNTLSSEEGFLYRVNMVRLKDNGSIVLKIEGIKDAPKSGILNLGGEGKVVVINALENFEKDDIFKAPNINTEFFKVYFATPAIFKKGWIPEWIDEKNLEGSKNGVKVKLVACAIGKPIRVGGWDLANSKPKPLYKAIPAGSVYYFRIERGSYDDVQRAFHFQNISDIYPEEGYGLALLAGC